MMHKAWSNIEGVSYCFLRSSVKFQGHTGQNIADFDPNWAFPDCNLSFNLPMAFKWCNIEEVPYCFSRSSCKVQGHTRQKTSILTQIGRFQTVTPVRIHWWLWMMDKAWSNIEEVPYWFSRLSVKFEGYTGQKIADFDPNWAFPDCNWSLNLPMALKWCTKLNIS